MIDISTLHPGDIVKIVDAWVEGCGENMDGYMDKYLGRTVTVRSVHGSAICIEEDQRDPHRYGGWSWFAPALEPVTDDLADFVPESDADFLYSLQTILGY